MNRLFHTIVLATLMYSPLLLSHCQMPCGIYHDDMVFDQIDQYIETMYKGISILNENKFGTVREKNEFIRWVSQKDHASDDVANTITTFFLQQKIKPGEKETIKQITSAHKLLFILVAIKQNTDLKFVEEFTDEWEKFKLMFHVEGYECKIEQIKMKKRQQLIEKSKMNASSAHDHEHEENISHNHDENHNHPHNGDHESLENSH